jgi:hypothetical protein
MTLRLVSTEVNPVWWASAASGRSTDLSGAARGDARPTMTR